MRVLTLSQTNAPWTPLYGRYLTAHCDAHLVVSVAPHKIEGVDSEFIGVEPWDKWKNKHLFLTRVPRIRKIIREFRPDVVFAPYIVSNGLSAVLSWSGPLVVSGHGGDVLEQAGRRGWRQGLRERIVKYVCRRSDVVHVVAEDLKAELLRLGVDESKLVTFSLGIDTELFTPAGDVPRLPAKRIVCTRKDEPVYDNGTIVSALQQVMREGLDFHATFVGGGEGMDTRRQQAEDVAVADRVEFEGLVPLEQIPRYLRESDIYVSASLSDGASSALLEAMASGLLPVVSRIPANTPWIEHGHNGLLFEPRDADDLAAQLLRGLRDDELRVRACEVNRARVIADGNLEKNNGRILSLLEQAVANRKS